MKYIRTNDGRVIDLTSKPVSSYEIIDDKTAKEVYGVEKAFIFIYYYDDNIGAHIEHDGKGGCSMDNYYLDEIRQTDNIEELFDGIIFKDTNTNKLHLDKINTKDGIFILGASLFSETVRGFIETNEGLKYVAKLAEEGGWQVL